MFDIGDILICNINKEHSPDTTFIKGFQYIVSDINDEYCCYSLEGVSNHIELQDGWDQDWVERNFKIERIKSWKERMCNNG